MSDLYDRTIKEHEMTITDDRPSIKCGHCGGRHPSAKDVQACYGGTTAPEQTKVPMDQKGASDRQVTYALDLLRTRVWPQTLDEQTIRAMDRRAVSTLISGLIKAAPKPDYEVAEKPPVPAGRYAIKDPEDGRVNFYQVDAPTTGRWAGHVFLKRLLGSPGDYRQERVGQPAIRAAIMAVLAENPQEYAATFGRESGHCGMCMSPLTKDRSLAAGYGQKCAENHGYAW